MEIAVAGLGRMGRALAARLVEQGASVTVWNRSAGPADELRAAGADVAGSVGALWGRAGVVMSFLADDRAVEAVCLGDGGLLASATPGGVLVEMSTISPGTSARVGAEAERCGVAYLRCPVSGNPGVLRSGKLLLIVSGPRAAYEAARPALELVANNSHYVGGSDEARVVKLAVNAVLAATTELLAETVTLCEAAGIERSAYVGVLAASALGSPFVAYKRDALVDRQYDATFTTEMLAKDLHLALREASERGIPLPVTELVAELTDGACDGGLGGYDFLALLPFLQHRAGVATDLPVRGG